MQTASEALASGTAASSIPFACPPDEERHYRSQDGLGSVVATNDPAGTVTHSVVFDAWGSVKAETGTRGHPFTYTGREVGEAGFHFYRARFYQPSIGRFSQEDPVKWIPPRPFYAYVRNSPAIYTDPSGMVDAVDRILAPEAREAFDLPYKCKGVPGCFGEAPPIVDCVCKCESGFWRPRTKVHFGGQILLNKDWNQPLETQLREEMKHQVAHQLFYGLVVALAESAEAIMTTSRLRCEGTCFQFKLTYRQMKFFYGNNVPLVPDVQGNIDFTHGWWPF